MALPALATPADATRFGYTIPADTAEALLDRASVRIRRAAGQPITPTVVVLRLAPEDGQLGLPAPPIIAVQSVTQVAPDGTTSPLPGWAWDGETLTGLGCAARVEVTYQRGWTVVPDGVVELTCQVAARLSETTPGMETGIRSETVDDYSVTFAAEQLQVAGDLLPGELTALRRELAQPEAWVVKQR